VLIVLGAVTLFLPVAVSHKVTRRAYKRRWQRILHLSIYYFFIVVIILMESVEIAGLARIEFGIGLLPFVYAGCIGCATHQATKGLWGKMKSWEVINVVFWVMSLAITVAKMVALGKLSNDEMYRRDEGSYAISHQITDIAVLIGFYAALFGLEIGLIFCKPWSETMRGQLVERVEQKA
jgi:hypothetical protein